MSTDKRQNIHGYIILLTVTILETGVSAVPCKSQKSSIWAGMGPTIALKSPGKGALCSTPSWGLQGLIGMVHLPKCARQVFLDAVACLLSVEAPISKKNQIPMRDGKIS